MTKIYPRNHYREAKFLCRYSLKPNSKMLLQLIIAVSDIYLQAHTLWVSLPLQLSKARL